jgi:hypothetical protein
MTGEKVPDFLCWCMYAKTEGSKKCWDGEMIKSYKSHSGDSFRKVEIAEKNGCAKGVYINK